MQTSSARLISAALAAAALGGCSSDGGLLGGAFTTQSIGTQQTAVAAAPKVDPACYALSQRIEALRRDGLTERLEKASVGNSANVTVKRASLAQAAELDKANAEFQARCSAPGLRPPQMAAPAAPHAPAPVVNQAQVVSATTPKPAIAPPVVVQQSP